MHGWVIQELGGEGGLSQGQDAKVVKVQGAKSAKLRRQRCREGGEEVNGEEVSPSPTN